MNDDTNDLSGIDPKMLARIQALRLMDDDFMTAVFAGDNALTEFLLKILLSRDDLRVKKSMTQKEMHNLFGRSVRLDILAEDESGKIYNIEIQRADKGADPRRARYNLALLDSHTLKRKSRFAELPETYIIFITENDIFSTGKAIYRLKKILEDDDGAILPFDDGAHTVYVNGAYRGDDAIGRLMHDFCESDAAKMNYEEIAERVKIHKQQTKGVRNMCRIFEEYGDERVAEAIAEKSKDVVEKLLRKNKLSLEEIADTADVPLEEVQKIAERIFVPE